MRGRMTAAAAAPLCQLRSSVSADFPQETISCMAAMANLELVEHSILWKALEPNSHAGSRNQLSLMRAFGSHTLCKQAEAHWAGGRFWNERYVQKEVDMRERGISTRACANGQNEGIWAILGGMGANRKGGAWEIEQGPMTQGGISVAGAQGGTTEKRANEPAGKFRRKQGANEQGSARSGGVPTRTGVHTRAARGMQQVLSCRSPPAHAGTQPQRGWAGAGLQGIPRVAIPAACTQVVLLGRDLRLAAYCLCLLVLPAHGRQWSQSKRTGLRDRKKAQRCQEQD